MLAASARIDALGWMSWRNALTGALGGVSAVGSPNDLVPEEAITRNARSMLLVNLTLFKRGGRARLFPGAGALRQTMSESWKKLKTDGRHRASSERNTITSRADSFSRL